MYLIASFMQIAEDTLLLLGCEGTCAVNVKCKNVSSDVCHLVFM